MWKAFLLLSFVASANALVKTCEPSDLPLSDGQGTFECMVDVIDEEPGTYTFHWTVDPTKEYVSAAVLLKREDAWFSLAFGSSCRSNRIAYPFTTTYCSMVPGVAAIAQVEGGEVTVGTYNITGFSTSSIQSVGSSEILEGDGGESSTELGGTVMYVTLQVVEDGVGANLQQATFLNYAFGDTGTLSMHEPSNAGTFSVELSSEPPANVEAPTEDPTDMKEERIVTSANECYPSNLVIEVGQGEEPVKFNCRQPVTAGSLEDVFLDWTVDDSGNAVTMALSARTGGYLAVGFPVQAGSMAPSDAVIGACSSPENFLPVQPYKISGYSSGDIVVDEAQIVMNAGCLYNDEITTIYFSREADNSGQVVLDLSGEQIPLIIAAGDSSSLDYHGSARGAVAVNFVNGQVSEENLAGSSDRITHGILMAVAWICMLPLGAAVGKFIQKSRSQPAFCKALYYSHILLQVSGLAIATAGFALAFIKFPVDLGEVPYGHGGIGVAVMVLTFLQPINAIVRPSADKMNKRRKIWEFVHGGTGKVALLLGAVNVFTGIQILAFDFGDVDQSLWVALCAGSLCLIVFARDMAEKYYDQQHREKSHSKTEMQVENRKEYQKNCSDEMLGGQCPAGVETTFSL